MNLLHTMKEDKECGGEGTEKGVGEERERGRRGGVSRATKWFFNHLVPDEPADLAEGALAVGRGHRAPHLAREQDVRGDGGPPGLGFRWRRRGRRGNWQGRHRGGHGGGGGLCLRRGKRDGGEDHRKGVSDAAVRDFGHLFLLLVLLLL